MLEGALDALHALGKDLVLRLDEARDETAREIYAEVLTVLDALTAEYHRRQSTLTAVSARHASYVFLLDERGEVHPLPHTLYVALVRDEATAPDFAGKILRLAEWYVRIEGEEPESVVNETYCFIAFDAAGRVDWSETPSFHPRRPDIPAAPKRAALPTAAERERILAQLFPAGAKGSGQ